MSKILPFRPRRPDAAGDAGFPQDLSDRDLEDLGRKALIATSGGALLFIFGTIIPPVGIGLSLVHYIAMIIGLLTGLPGSLMTIALQKEWRQRHPTEGNSNESEQG